MTREVIWVVWVSSMGYNNVFRNRGSGEWVGQLSENERVSKFVGVGVSDEDTCRKGLCWREHLTLGWTRGADPLPAWLVYQCHFHLRQTHEKIFTRQDVVRGRFQLIDYTIDNNLTDVGSGGNILGSCLISRVLVLKESIKDQNYAEDVNAPSVDRQPTSLSTLLPYGSLVDTKLKANR